MGPEPESSGKPALCLTYVFDANQLQWGRSRKAPENFQSLPDQKIYTSLQWGRSRKAPENVSSITYEDYITTTSMGPEPESSGKHFDEAKLLGFVITSMGPEPESSGKLTMNRRTMPYIPNFNGAGAGKLRKTSSQLQWPASCKSLQWGRSRKAPENCNSTYSQAQTPGHFNGAGAGKLRKTSARQ